MNGEPSQQPPVGWLKFFFEDYLPESPCPPGCRHIHSGWRKQPGSVSSGSPLSSCLAEDFFADSSSAYTSEEHSHYNKFSPIPMLLDQAPRKLDILFSDRSSTSSHNSRSPPGYPEDGFRDNLSLKDSTSSRDKLSPSDQELKQLDDLISLYSDILSETESERDSSRKSSRSASENAEFHRKSPEKQKFSFSDGDIHRFELFSSDQPSKVGDCLMSNCHCTLNEKLKIEDLLQTSPLVHAQKLVTRNVSTQCVFSDITDTQQIPSPVFIRKRSPTDEDTLTKFRQRLSSRSPSPETCQKSYYSDLDNSSSSDEGGDLLPYFPEPPRPTYNLPPLKTGLHVELSASSSGGKTSSSQDTPGSTSAITSSTGDSLTAVSPLKQPEGLADFPPFVIDFFEFAARPEDYLTDSQLEWYYEGEAKLMKRREERKRARNALIEETIRLEAANNPEAADKKPSVGVQGISPREIAAKTTPYNADIRSNAPDVELDVDIPSDLLDNPTVIRLAQQLQTSENHRKEVLINCAKLENERSTLIYKVEDLKDLLEDQSELASELKITLKAKCRDIEKLKMQMTQRSKEVDLLTCQVQQREELLKEKAGIIITQLGDIMEVPLDEINLENGDHVTDKYSIKKVEDIEKQNNQLKEEIAALREELQSRAQNHVSNNTPDVTAPDYQNLMNVRRQLEKDIEVYKARLTVEERDKIKLQGQISVLDSQVKRYRGQVQSSSEAEDEALREKRRLQKELRIKNEELTHCRDECGMLTKKLEKTRTVNNR